MNLQVSVTKKQLFTLETTVTGTHGTQTSDHFQERGPALPRIIMRHIPCIPRPYRSPFLFKNKTANLTILEFSSKCCNTKGGCVALCLFV
jgi:hypothetical protein